MVLEAVEVVERRAPRRVVAARASPVGVEVPLPGHGTYGETGGIGRAMQRAHRVEAPVLMVHPTFRTSLFDLRHFCIHPEVLYNLLTIKGDCYARPTSIP